MTNDQTAATKTPYFAVVDEMGYYFGRNDDALSEELRGLDGVPNASYVVSEGNVFVFQKLVDMVAAKRRERGDATPLADMVRDLMPQAFVTPEVAVRAWNVLPEPYELQMSAGGQTSIRHRAFNALLPVRYANKEDAQAALAILLAGGSIPGRGDFSYNGQQMSLIDPIDMALLPPRPTFRADLEPGSWFWTNLGGSHFEPGFEPLSEADFDVLKALEMSWKKDSAAAERFARSSVASLWTRTAEFPFAALNDPRDVLSEVPDDCEQSEAAALRSLYPELAMLTNASLHDKFFSYQRDCIGEKGSTPRRDDEFLFYLLCRTAIRNDDAADALKTGCLIAYALLHGDSLDKAFAFGRAGAIYDTAVGSTARQVSMAMRFLVEQRERGNLRGPEIMTMMDTFRMARKVGMAPLVAQQSEHDFEGIRARLEAIQQEGIFGGTPPAFSA